MPTETPNTKRRRVEYVPLGEILDAPVNGKDHAEEVLDASIDRWGLVDLPVVDERTGLLLGGHGRRDALRRRQEAGETAPVGVKVARDGTWLVPVQRGWASKDDTEAEAVAIALNRSGEIGGWKDEILTDQLRRLVEIQDGLVGTGYTVGDLELMLAEKPTEPPTPTPSLADRFLIPPFSVFDARQGYWQTRKRQWIALGIRSEEGRPANHLADESAGVASGSGHKGALRLDVNATTKKKPKGGRPNQSRGSIHVSDTEFYVKKRRVEAEIGRELTTQEFVDQYYETEIKYGGTSIFDPVLCEVAYRWFCPPGGSVLDPFAGGSVRGIVAAALGLSYSGVDLRDEQVRSNESQYKAMKKKLPGSARWIVGDALDSQPTGPFDFLFTCPPYFDLEIYSDDARDLSNSDDYESFRTAYYSIIDQGVERLADNRFAAIVVGDIRDNRGIYRSFVADTVDAFRRAGADFYNDAILITAIGSVPLRAARTFRGGRKLAKTHQNVLVFVKGDPRVANDALGDLVIDDACFPDDEPAV